VSYANPMAALNRYLDVLDLHGVPVAARVLAALGPKTLELAHQRAGGVVPYLRGADRSVTAEPCMW
jgi:hypothetical protein